MDQEEVVAAVRAAVEQEREACAVAVENFMCPDTFTGTEIYMKFMMDFVLPREQRIYSMLAKKIRARAHPRK